VDNLVHYTKYLIVTARGIGDERRVRWQQIAQSVAIIKSLADAGQTGSIVYTAFVLFVVVQLIMKHNA
jgi:hypothetical protein